MQSPIFIRKRKNKLQTAEWQLTPYLLAWLLGGQSLSVCPLRVCKVHGFGSSAFKVWRATLAQQTIDLSAVAVAVL